MEFPEGLHYSKEHEWVRADGDRMVVGITDYAQDALGDVVYVDLPEVGSESSAGDVVCEVESTKSVSEIYAPLTGRIVAVNESLLETPEMINSAPYADGWIFAMEADPEALGGLLDVAGYRDLVE